jgi:hypothetical protein
MTIPIGKYLKRRQLTRAQWREAYSTMRNKKLPHEVSGAIMVAIDRHAPLALDRDFLAERAAFRAIYTETGARIAMPAMIRRTHGLRYHNPIGRRIPRLPLRGYFYQPRVVHLPGTQ